MPKIWIDQNAIRRDLKSFFKSNSKDFVDFGQRVNQTFEAFVLASVIEWYSRHGWKVDAIHPKKSNGSLRLKFSTRGAPSNYSYFICAKGEVTHQMHHQLRVKTWFQPSEGDSNICLDIAIILPTDISRMSTDTAIANERLVSFGEAKHMSAYAELVAQFLGIVHELQPDRLIPTEVEEGVSENLDAFLYVSGYLSGTAQGLYISILERNYDVQVFDVENPMSLDLGGYRQRVLGEEEDAGSDRQVDDDDIPF